MYVDGQLEFSDNQSITASAAGTNIIDFNPAFNYNSVIDAGAGEPTYLVVIPAVTFAAAGAGTLTIELRSYAQEDLSDTPEVILTSKAIVLASLVAGKPALVVALPPADYRRYLGIYYTVGNGPFTAGQVDAFITKDAQTWRSYSNNSEFADLNLGSSDADSVSFAETTASVAVGATTTVDVEESGDSAVSVASSASGVATATYANGVVTITGVAAGTATITITKGSATATITVTVTA